MGKIANYNIVNPKGDDKIIISETSGSVKDATKNITVDGIANYTNSKLPENNTIPVPELYIVKKKSTTDDLWGINSKLCIKGFQEKIQLQDFLCIQKTKLKLREPP